MVADGGEVSGGKIGSAPCGHRGEAVVGQYYRCLEGCDRAGAGPESDGVPDEESDDHVTEPLCLHCGSDDVQIWPGFMVSGKDLFTCRDCGRSFQS